MPSVIRINSVAGSDESATDFDGTTAITLDSPTTTTYLWEFLDWPLDSSFDQTWLVGVGATNPTVVFTPDQHGTWVVKLTDTNDSTTDTIVVGIRSRKSNTRIPGATETTETDNVTYAAVLNHRGWANERNKRLDVWDDLITSGGVQVCYLDDAAGVGAGVDAGELLSLELNGGEIIDPTSGELVPTVKLAQATFASGNYRYVGALKAGRVTGAANPGANQFSYATTSIQNQTFVWVSRSGMVAGGAAGTLDLSTYAKGDIAYLSTTAGTPTIVADRFAGTAPEIMVPVGYVVDNANPGTLLVLPSMTYTGPQTAQQETKFLGIGDFSVLRVGNVPIAGYTPIAGEESPAVEVVGVNQEAFNITQGMVVCINSNGVYKADSSLDPSVSSNRNSGVFGVAVELVAAGAVGHYTIFGRCPNATTASPVTGEVVYVGSSTADSGDLSGQAVKLSLIQVDFTDGYGNTTIPLGTWDGTELIMGVLADDGLTKEVTSSLGQTVGDYDGDLNSAKNTSTIEFNKANVYARGAGYTVIDLPGTRSEDNPIRLSMYEDTIKGEDLYDITNTSLAGISYAGGMDIPGAPLYNGTWNPGGAPAANVLYGSFQLDSRLQIDLSPITLEISGYTDDADLGSIQLDVDGRVVTCDETSGGPTTFSASKGVQVNNTSTDIPLRFIVDLNDDTSDAAHYIPLPGANGEAVSVDFVIARSDALTAGLLITKVVLRASYAISNLEVGGISLFEYKRPGYAIGDAVTSGFNIVNDQATVGANDTVGIKMSEAYGVGQTSELVGFIPVDSRLLDSASVVFDIIGKYQGAGGGAQSIDLDLTYRYEYCDTEYNADITVGGTTIATSSETPVGSAAPTYETLCWSITVPGATHTNLAGIRYMIERVGTNPLTTGAGEDFFQIANVMAREATATPTNTNPEIFEHKSDLLNVLDNTAIAFNADWSTSYNGFLFSNGGSEELNYYVAFDYRYNFRDNLEIKVYGWVEASAATPGVTLDLAIDAWNFDSTTKAKASYTTYQSVSVDVSGYAANNRVVCHTFYIAADELWRSDNPDFLDLSPDVNHGVMLNLSRSDAAAIDYTAMSINVTAASGNSTSKLISLMDISEDNTSVIDYLREPAFFRSSSQNIFLASVNRQTYVFGADGSIAVANAAQLDIQPSGFSSATSGAARGTGHLMPYSCVITHVHGWAVDFLVRDTPLTGSTLTFSIVDSGGIAVTNSGIINFPLTVTFLDDGSFRWNGTPGNFNVPDGADMPLVYLPADYSAGATPRWWLNCEFDNATGGGGAAPIDLMANIIVEVQLIPNTDIVV